MPSLVGGFGNYGNFSFIFLKNKKLIWYNYTYILFKNCYYLTLYLKSKLSLFSNLSIHLNLKKNISTNHNSNLNKNITYLGSYLAGLIEGDGTFAIHEKDSTAKKYSPMIIIIFKKADLPLAEFLQDLTQCGSVEIKLERNYVLWKICDIKGVFKLVNLINGWMRTPKIEALYRTIEWLNNYQDKNQNSKLPSTQNIISELHYLEKKPLDKSSIESNPWFSGFSDADSNFSINIHKRSNRNSTRVQLYYRLDIRQTYHRSSIVGESFFPILSEIATYLNTNILSRTREKGDKKFYSFIITSHNKLSRDKVVNYFETFPLLSSKYLDYKSWTFILELQKQNYLTTSYLDKAESIRKDYNDTRTTYNWDHLDNCYLINSK